MPAIINAGSSPVESKKKGNTASLSSSSSLQAKSIQVRLRKAAEYLVEAGFEPEKEDYNVFLPTIIGPLHNGFCIDVRCQVLSRDAARYESVDLSAIVTKRRKTHQVCLKQDGKNLFCDIWSLVFFPHQQEGSVQEDVVFLDKWRLLLLRDGLILSYYTTDGFGNPLTFSPDMIKIHKAMTFPGPLPKYLSNRKMVIETPAQLAPAMEVKEMVYTLPGSKVRRLHRTAVIDGVPQDDFPRNSLGQVCAIRSDPTVKERVIAIRSVPPPPTPGSLAARCIEVLDKEVLSACEALRRWNHHDSEMLRAPRKMYKRDFSGEEPPVSGPLMF